MNYLKNNLNNNFLFKYIKYSQNENGFISVSFLDNLNPNDLQSDIQLNSSVNSIAKKIFNESIPELNKTSQCCIAYTGSDGRNEKINWSSNLELQLIFQARNDYNREIVTKIAKVAKDNPHIFYHELEILFIECDNLLMYNRNRDINGKKDVRPFPTRALDSTKLVGSEVIMSLYKMKFMEQLRQKESIKPLRKFRSSAMNGSRQVLKKCLNPKNPDMSAIDLSKGVVSYDNEKIKGVKYPILRVVQYKLADLIFDHIKNSKNEVTTKNLPLSTIERIDFLAKNSLLRLSKEDIEELKLNYSKALLLYAASQELYYQKEVKQIHMAPVEIKKIASKVLEFSQKQLKLIKKH